MQIQLKKTELLSYILTPASKLTDNLVLEFNNDESIVKTLITSADNSLICRAKIKAKFADNADKLIIPDCKTFVRLVSNINEENLHFEIFENNISYNSNSFSFKYYLLDESYIVTKKSISEQKIDNIEYETNFHLNKTKLNEISKYNSILPEAEKLYFFSGENKSIHVKIGDEQKTNLNELTLELAKSFNGSPFKEKFPISIQNILLFSFTEENLLASFNHALKILKIESPNLSYIVSGLVK